MIYAEQTSPELGKIAPKMIAVLPIAAIEQHGNHLPVVTDTAIGTELARRVEQKLPKLVALLPTLWCGSSHHHTGFPGTLSLRSETYIQVLVDLVDCLIDTGFRRIYLLNCHGGNQIPFSEALYRLNMKHKGPKEPWVAAPSYWQVAVNELRGQSFMDSPRLTHACEYETSMMLALKTEWVKPQSHYGVMAAPGSKYYDPTGEKASRVTVSQSFHQITSSGSLGAPEKASAKKGEQLFSTITPVLVDFLKEFSTWKRQQPRKTKSGK